MDSVLSTKNCPQCNQPIETKHYHYMLYDHNGVLSREPIGATIYYTCGHSIYLTLHDITNKKD